MSYTRVKSVNFGAARADLATVGYTLTGGGRTTSGVAQTVAGSGCYAATVAFADAFAGTITWDTGGASPSYAVEEVNPGADEFTDAKVSTRSTLAAAGVWDLATAGHTGTGSFGSAMNAAGSSGDPWATPLPGAYGGGTAGNVLGTNLDAAVSSRLAASGYAAPLSAPGVRAAVGLAAADLDTQLGAIGTKTANLPAAPAAVGSPMGLADGAITSAKFTVAPVTGPAAGILEQIRQTWRRFFGPSAKNQLAGTISTLADDGATVLTEQNFTDDGAGNETLGAAT